jgi:hypothetical protein
VASKSVQAAKPSSSSYSFFPSSPFSSSSSRHRDFSSSFHRSRESSSHKESDRENGSHRNEHRDYKEDRTRDHGSFVTPRSPSRNHRRIRDHGSFVTPRSPSRNHRRIRDYGSFATPRSPSRSHRQFSQRRDQSASSSASSSRSSFVPPIPHRSYASSSIPTSALSLTPVIHSRSQSDSSFFSSSAGSIMPSCSDSARTQSLFASEITRVPPAKVAEPVRPKPPPSLSPANATPVGKKPDGALSLSSSSSYVAASISPTSSRTAISATTLTAQFSAATLLGSSVSLSPMRVSPGVVDALSPAPPAGLSSPSPLAAVIDYARQPPPLNCENLSTPPTPALVQARMTSVSSPETGPFFGFGLPNCHIWPLSGPQWPSTGQYVPLDFFGRMQGRWVPSNQKTPKQTSVELSTNCYICVCCNSGTCLAASQNRAPCFFCSSWFGGTVDRNCEHSSTQAIYRVMSIAQRKRDEQKLPDSVPVVFDMEGPQGSVLHFTVTLEPFPNEAKVEYYATVPADPTILCSATTSFLVTPIWRQFPVTRSERLHDFLGRFVCNDVETLNLVWWILTSDRVRNLVKEFYPLANPGWHGRNREHTWSVMQPIPGMGTALASAPSSSSGSLLSSISSSSSSSNSVPETSLSFQVSSTALIDLAQLAIASQREEYVESLQDPLQLRGDSWNDYIRNLAASLPTSQMLNPVASASTHSSPVMAQSSSAGATTTASLALANPSVDAAMSVTTGGVSCCFVQPPAVTPAPSALSGVSGATAASSPSVDSLISVMRPVVRPDKHLLETLADSPEASASLFMNASMTSTSGVEFVPVPRGGLLCPPHLSSELGIAPRLRTWENS